VEEGGRYGRGQVEDIGWEDGVIAISEESKNRTLKIHISRKY